MEHGKSIEPTTTTSAMGWQYSAGSLVAQFRIDGFTFSKLEPYTTWEEVFAEASRLWQLYVAKAQPPEGIRVAGRDINRLRVPVPAALCENFAPPPVLAFPSPHLLFEFFLRIVLNITT